MGDCIGTTYFPSDSEQRLLNAMATLSAERDALAGERDEWKQRCKDGLQVAELKHERAELRAEVEGFKRCLLQAQNAAIALAAEGGALRAALQSIAANTCCDKCQEAALVASAALADKPLSGPTP